MKKVFLSLAIVAALTVVSCKQADAAADATADTTAVDTTAAPEVAPVADTTAADTTAAPAAPAADAAAPAKKK